MSDPSPAVPTTPTVLYDGDAGTMDMDSRRALFSLVKGPYVDAERTPDLWAAILTNTAGIRAALGNIFLELVVDERAEVAFARNVRTEAIDAPKVMRTARLTLLDTALVVHLRRLLLAAQDEQVHVIVGDDELLEHLSTLSPGHDASSFAARCQSSIAKMRKYGILLDTPTEGRREVAPILALLFTADEVAGVLDSLEAFVVDDGKGRHRGDRARSRKDDADA